VKKVKTGKRPQDRREDGGNTAGGETELMLDGFRARNGFRERLVTKLTERGYHGRKAGGPACLGGGPGCERLRLNGVRTQWRRPFHFRTE